MGTTGSDVRRKVLSFDNEKHPRGHVHNLGGFAAKSQSAPDKSADLTRGWPASPVDAEMHSSGQHQNHRSH
jgi:hypothetical protein